MSFSALTGTTLGWGRLPYGTLLRIDLADLAANPTLPGGRATSATVRFRQFAVERILQHCGNGLEDDAPGPVIGPLVCF